MINKGGAGKLARLLARMPDKQVAHLITSMSLVQISAYIERGIDHTLVSGASCGSSKQEWGSETSRTKTNSSITKISQAGLSYGPINKPRCVCLRELEDWEYQRQLFEGFQLLLATLSAPYPPLSSL